MEIEPEVDLFSGGFGGGCVSLWYGIVLTLASDVDERRENSGKWRCQSHDWASSS